MRFLPKHFQRSLFYRKSLQIILLASILPSVMIAIGSYYTGTWQIEKEVRKNQLIQTEQNNAKLSDQFSMLEQIVVKWSFNDVFTKMLKIEDINKDYENVNSLYSTLTLIKNSHSLIGDVVFHMKDKNIIISESGVVRLSPSQEEEVSHLLNSGRDFYYVNGTPLSVFRNADAMATVLVCKVHILGQTENASILVSLNPQAVDDMLSQLAHDPQSVAFLLYPDLSVYLPSGDTDSLKRALTNQLCREILQGHTPSDAFLQTFRGDIYSVSYSTYLRNGWIFAEALPLAKMLEPVRTTSRILLVISLAVFGVIVLIALFLTRRIYRPVEQLTSFLSERLGDASRDSALTDEFRYIRNNFLRMNLEQNELRAYLEKNKLILRESFLFQLIQGNLSHYSEQELSETMTRMGWDLNASGYAVAFLKIFLPEGEGAKFNHGDEALATYAAVNIIEETLLGDPHFPGIINFHNLSAGLIIRHPDADAQADWPAVEAALNLVLERLSGYLDMQVVMGVSRHVPELRDIPSAYAEAFQTVRFRDVRHVSELILSRDLLLSPASPVEFPMRLEDEIIHDLRIGLVEELREKVLRFVDALKINSGKEFYIQQGMLHLLGGVLHALQQSGVDVQAMYAGKNLYEQLCQIKEPEKMAEWFLGAVVSPFAAENQRTAEVLHHQLVDRVLGYIHEHYVRDISLDICAGECGIPPRRLSVIFYKVTGTYFGDYVIDYRLTKARELLINTDESVIHIAFMVGYQPQYFNKIFKKKEGITPGDFRKKYR